MGELSPATPGRETLTRNWNELLQELRVMQTGAQILTGFLLTVPFTSVFADLSQREVRTYLAVLCGAVVTTGFFVAPVAFHRLLFRRRQRPWLVRAGNACARIGLACFAVTSAGVLFLVFDVVVGLAAASVVLGSALAFFALLWVGLPLLGERVTQPTPPPEEDQDPTRA